MTSCFICFDRCENIDVVCAACMHLLDPVDVEHACLTCKAPLPIAQVCGHCLNARWYFNTVHVGAYYTAMARYLLHHYKFYKGLLLLPQFSKLLIERLSGDFEASRPDLIVPVPLHRLRLLWRGFNQAHELAKRVGRAFDIPVSASVAYKVKYTRAQARLKFSERGRGLRSSFQVNLPVGVRHVLIVDDVFTTGNTVNALARAFVSAGAERVDVLALFRAI